MKKFLLIFCAVLPLVLTSCGSQTAEKNSFISTFSLDIKEDDFSFTQIFNNYKGVHYEGMALYKISFNEGSFPDSILSWDTLPLPDYLDVFLLQDTDSIASEIGLPNKLRQIQICRSRQHRVG